MYKSLGSPVSSLGKGMKRIRRQWGFEAINRSFILHRSIPQVPSARSRRRRPDGLDQCRTFPSVALPRGTRCVKNVLIERRTLIGLEILRQAHVADVAKPLPRILFQIGVESAQSWTAASTAFMNGRCNSTPDNAVGQALWVTTTKSSSGLMWIVCPKIPSA